MNFDFDEWCCISEIFLSGLGSILRAHHAETRRERIAAQMMAAWRSSETDEINGMRGSSDWIATSARRDTDALIAALDADKPQDDG